MNILMVTNTYRPHIGGVANSVYSFSVAFERQGHKVLIICPEYPSRYGDGPPCIRVQALQRFNTSDFSLPISLPADLIPKVAEFKPDLIHSHHPFLLGDTALRLSSQFDVPLVFTHHTRYEEYTHYSPVDAPVLRRYVEQLATGYANLCNCVIAPSGSIASLLHERGVESRIEVVPTGVELGSFASGDGVRFRKAVGIPEHAYVVGHVGRLAPEKNLEFLANSVARFVETRTDAYFLVVGEGPSRKAIQEIFYRAGISDRLRLVGERSGSELVDSYHAMNQFVFASKTETQGMVVAEAFAAALPVVALSAPGTVEVVRSGMNGELVISEDPVSFAHAISALSQANPQQLATLATGIKHSAAELSIERCAERAISIYRSLLGIPITMADAEDSAWYRTLRALESESSIWANRVGSSAEAVTNLRSFHFPPYARLRLWFRRLRLLLSRNEFVIRLLKMSRLPQAAREPGLIMVQIDGLSQTNLEQAFRRRRLPFLARLVTKEAYRLHTVYSGVPSTTPVIQGMLFYGAPYAVPAFEFYDRASDKVVTMITPEAAKAVERRISTAGKGLLNGGSAYVNIYTGGAAEAHFCASAVGWGDLFYLPNPFTLLLLSALYCVSLIRIIVLLPVEALLTVVDFILGFGPKFHLGREIKFIPVRVAISVLVRELITIGACLDAFRGVPVIHLNYLGYDEQAHRRGPASRYAHWTLKGIDRCIKRIWQAAHNSPRRRYDLWVYSDHGQEHSEPYELITGQSVAAAVNECVKGLGVEEVGVKGGGVERIGAAGLSPSSSGERHQRAGWISAKFMERLFSPQSVSGNGEVKVTNLGPVAHVYLTSGVDGDALTTLCEKLSTEKRIPLVLSRVHAGQGAVWREGRRYDLPEDQLEIFGSDHPFATEVAQDLVALLSHPDSGEVVLLGWRKGAKPITFAMENGSHAGPGVEETRAFALLPASANGVRGPREYLTFLELREIALNSLGQCGVYGSTAAVMSKRPSNVLRLVSYNVHSCVGVDGALSPRRIAQVIAECEPDVVALQELDVRRRRSEFSHQVEEIAHELQMDYRFHPALEQKGELYGDAILSRYPIRLVKSGALPTLETIPPLEPRGALWVEVELPSGPIQVINTHLGLRFAERKLQAEALMSSEWLGDPRCNKRTTLCGDFNALPNSLVWRTITHKMTDLQRALENHRPRGTYPTGFGSGRIDHVFLTPDLKPLAAEVPRTTRSRVASDHFPLVVEIGIREGGID